MPADGRFGGKRWRGPWRNVSGTAAAPRSHTDYFSMIKMQSVTILAGMFRRQRQ
jgi:hypothetical protein